jgi:metal-responsive CopG/Arc/MetJ family transcriptional regulator
MAEKAKTGRPAKPKEERMIVIPIRFPPAMIEQVDRLPEIVAKTDERSRVIRTLVREALEARAKRKKS